MNKAKKCQLLERENGPAVAECLAALFFLNFWADFRKKRLDGEQTGCRFVFVFGSIPRETGCWRGGKKSCGYRVYVGRLRLLLRELSDRSLGDVEDGQLVRGRAEIDKTIKSGVAGRGTGLRGNGVKRGEERTGGFWKVNFSGLSMFYL